VTGDLSAARPVFHPNNQGSSVKSSESQRLALRRQSTPFVLLLIVAALLSACSSTLQVRSDVDPSADFSQYRSYEFFNPMGIEGGYNSPIFGEHFRAAISRELNQRRYRQNEMADLMVNVTIRSDDRVKMTSYTAPYMSGAYYSRPGGAHYGSSLGVGVGFSQRATKVTEASVFIDLVDRKQQKVVWQGVAVLDVTDKVAQQLRDAIYTAVNEVFKQYPNLAGA
jgi:hypothetical protein